MTITYCRNDPISSRWVGADRLLTEYEIDYNFYQHETRIAVLEANYTVTVSLAAITQPSPSTLLFTLTDASTQGPFNLPTGKLRSRGAWAPLTPYLEEDSFTTNGAYYRVLVDHTSAATFSPTANDGAGHDYYEEMIPPIGNALPTGGAAGMVLNKSSSTDYAVSWGYKLPTGGTFGQVLLKQSSTNQDAAWTTLGASMVSFNPSTASGLTSNNVAAALEELEILTRSGALAGLTDVHFGTGDPATGAILYFAGATWAASASPATNALLRWNGSIWVPVDPATLLIRNATITALDFTTGVSPFDPTLGNIFTVTPTGNITLNAASAPAGAEITLIVTTAGTSSFNITPTTNFKSQGALATGTVSGKTFTMKFIGDGTNLIETSRTAAM